MNFETIRRLAVARHLNELATSSLRSTNDVHLFAASNLLQDAVEAFLLAIADHVNAAVDQNTKFDKYFVEIERCIAPKELPFKLKLIRLNRIRVASKHYGIQPSRDECERLAVAVREFFDEVAHSLLGVSFSTVSTLDLLVIGSTRDALLEARTALDSGNRWACSIACRKALYLEIEQRYDVTKFKDQMPVGLLNGFSDAPGYARTPDYVREHVNNPTDFIVLDHSKLDHDLVKDGVDSTAFWNLWRLTPQVYLTPDKNWVVKEEFDKQDDDFLSNSIEYIFSATVDIVLALHTARRAVKSPENAFHFIYLVGKNALIYEKADSQSKVTGTTPTGMTEMHSDYRVFGLRADALYYHVFEFRAGFYHGYIHEDDVRDIVRVL
jgi:hypothetical protein